MINFRIMAFDPGGTTGWTTWSAQRVPFYNGLVIDHFEFYDTEFNCGYFGPGEHHDELYTFLEIQTVEKTFIVSESFEFRNKHRDNVELISREYIGIIKLFTAQRKLNLALQTASQGKVVDRKDTGFVKLENLKRLGLYKSPLEIWKHSMDAYGHILYWMINNHIYSEELLEAGWKK